MLFEHERKLWDMEKRAWKLERDSWERERALLERLIESGKPSEKAVQAQARDLSAVPSKRERLVGLFWDLGLCLRSVQAS